MKTAAGLENVFVSPKEYEQMIRAEERAAAEREIAEWLRKHAAHSHSACDDADAIERGDYRVKT